MYTHVCQVVLQLYNLNQSSHFISLQVYRIIFPKLMSRKRIIKSFTEAGKSLVSSFTAWQYVIFLITFFPIAYSNYSSQ